jgi:hypothetical protein
VASSGFSIANSRHSSACARHRLLLSIIPGSCAHRLAMASTIFVAPAVRGALDRRPESPRHTGAAFASSDIPNRKAPNTSGPLSLLRLNAALTRKGHTGTLRIPEEKRETKV